MNGKIEEETKNIYNPYKYAGYEQNLVGSTYNLGVRTYNPEIGRFIQEDTYLGDGLNLYVYVSGNPLKYVDPSGYCKEINPDNNDFKHNWNGVIAPTEYTYNSRKNEVSYMPIRGRERQAYFQGKNLTKEEIIENIVVNAIKGKDAALGSIDAVSNELSFGLLKKYGITSEELVTHSDYYNVANELTEKGMTAAELASIVGSAETIAKEAVKHGDDLIKLGSKVIRKNADDVVSTANKDFKFDMQLLNKGTGKLDDLMNAKSLGKGSTGRTVANSLNVWLK